MLPPTASFPSFGLLDVWVIIAMSTSSNSPQPHKLGLSTQELYLPLASELVPVLDLDILLGRHRDQRDPPPQVFQHTGGLETHRYPQHVGDLGVVAAGVSGPGVGVLVGMAEDLQRVQLPHHRHGRPRAPPVQRALDTGQGDTVLIGDTKGLELLGDESGGLLFAVAGLRVIQNGLSHAYELVGPPVLSHLELRL